MKEYQQSQEREVQRYLDEIKDVAVASAHDKRIENGLAFFGLWQMKRQLSILDVGCRDGRQMQILLNMGFTDVNGIDISETVVKICCEKGLSVWQSDVHELTGWDVYKKFDVIIATHVIEHCHTPQNAIEELGIVLKDGGLLMIEVPIGRKDRNGDWGHYVNFTNTASLLEDCGLELEVVKQEDIHNTGRLVLRKTGE